MKKIILEIIERTNNLKNGVYCTEPGFTIGISRMKNLIGIRIDVDLPSTASLKTGDYNVVCIDFNLKGKILSSFGINRSTESKRSFHDEITKGFLKVFLDSLNNAIENDMLIDIEEYYRMQERSNQFRDQVNTILENLSIAMKILKEERHIDNDENLINECISILKKGNLAEHINEIKDDPEKSLTYYEDRGDLEIIERQICDCVCSMCIFTFFILEKPVPPDIYDFSKAIILSCIKYDNQIYN